MRVWLDEETLKAVASRTQGEYYYAGAAENLWKVYETLSSRLTVEKKDTEVSGLFALAAAVLSLLAAGLSLLWFNRIPWPPSARSVPRYDGPMDAGEREVVFRAEGLTKVYRMGGVDVHALCSVDLVLCSGEFVVLLGPSGSGKSTLLNILGGLNVPTTGHVWYHGEDLMRANDAQLTQLRREHVGFVFPFYNLIPSLTVRENVAIVTEIAPHPLPPEEARAMVGLSERLDHFSAQLSGGEQQRVAIARGIAKRPAVMLCDEPTGALDSATGVRVLEALERVNAEMGTTTVVITHNADIARMAQRVLWLQDGCIERERTNAERVQARELNG